MDCVGLSTYRFLAEFREEMPQGMKYCIYVC